MVIFFEIALLKLLILKNPTVYFISTNVKNKDVEMVGFKRPGHRKDANSLLRTGASTGQM